MGDLRSSPYGGNRGTNCKRLEERRVQCAQFTKISSQLPVTVPFHAHGGDLSKQRSGSIGKSLVF
jgi:hypothetical protein